MGTLRCPSEGVFVAWVPRREQPVIPVIDLEVGGEAEWKDVVDNGLHQLVDDFADVAATDDRNSIAKRLCDGEGRLEFGFRVRADLDQLHSPDFCLATDTALDRREMLDPRILKFVDLERAIHHRGLHYVNGLV